MAATGRMNLSIDLAKYYSLPDGVRARFDAWLDAEHLTERNVVKLTLGEGEVVIERIANDENGRPLVDENDDLVHTVERVPVRSVPPKEAF